MNQTVAPESLSPARVEQTHHLDMPPVPGELRTPSHRSIVESGVRLDSRMGVVALSIALLGLALGVLVLVINLEAWVPLLACLPAITLGIVGLTRRFYRKSLSILAIIIASIALIPSGMAYALAADSVAPSGAATDDSSLLGGILDTVTGTTATNGSGPGGVGGAGGAGGSGGTGTNGTTPTTPATPVTPTTPVTPATPVTPVDGTPVVEVALDGGGLHVDVFGSSIVETTTGGVGDLLTTASGVDLTVTSVQCGLPVVSVGGLGLELFGDMCAVSVSLTNGSDHAVDLNSSTLTGIVGGTGILGDSSLGTALNARVQSGSSTSGTIYVKLPSGQTDLDSVQIRLGGEPAASPLTVAL